MSVSTLIIKATTKAWIEPMMPPTNNQIGQKNTAPGGDLEGDELKLMAIIKPEPATTNPNHPSNRNKSSQTECLVITGDVSCLFESLIK